VKHQSRWAAHYSEPRERGPKTRNSWGGKSDDEWIGQRQAGTITRNRQLQSRGGSVQGAGLLLRGTPPEENGPEAGMTNGRPSLRAKKKMWVCKENYQGGGRKMPTKNPCGKGGAGGSNRKKSGLEFERRRGGARKKKTQNDLTKAGGGV